MTGYIKLCALCLALMITSCAEIVVKQVNYATAPKLPRDATPAPVIFNGLRILLPPGTEIGLESGMGPSWLGGICSWGNYPVSRRVLRRKFETQYLDITFEDALEALGYDVANDIRVDFKRDDFQARADYMVSAKLVDVDLDLCKRGRLTPFEIFNTAPGAKGKMYGKFEWSVYDALRRTVVYKTVTEGYTRRDYPNTEGLEVMFMDVFDMASHNLGADPVFYDLVVNGVKPPRDNGRMFDKPPRKERPRVFDPQAALDLPAQILRTRAFSAEAEVLRHNAVTIQKLGHGSGFFISKEGHILTNHHVVGEAQRVRVIFADKEHAMTAEVLRVDRTRDVALLRLVEPLPASYKAQILPLRLRRPAVSEDIYAIGSPRHYSITENTVTKGIVSAHRRLKHQGVVLDYMQGDITVHAGNSGGPLLDERGNIVGMTVLALFPDPDNHAIDLNLFIPIAEALHVLDITVDGVLPDISRPSAKSVPVVLE